MRLNGEESRRETPNRFCHGGTENTERPLGIRKICQGEDGRARTEIDSLLSFLLFVQVPWFSEPLSVLSVPPWQNRFECYPMPADFGAGVGIEAGEADYSDEGQHGEQGEG